MCLGQVVQVVEVTAADRVRARSGGRAVVVSLLTLPDAEPGVQPGDWLLVHSGFALDRLTSLEAAEALAMRSGAGFGSDGLGGADGADGADGASAGVTPTTSPADGGRR